MKLIINNQEFTTSEAIQTGYFVGLPLYIEILRANQLITRLYISKYNMYDLYHSLDGQVDLNTLSVYLPFPYHTVMVSVDELLDDETIKAVK
jgi:hypothetical protein